jgi:hypothetical protein
LLFAKLLEWEEFQDVRRVVDDYIDKVYEKYQLLKTHTTKELLEIDEESAMWKYAVDRQFGETQEIAEIEDKYAYLATFKFFTAEEKEKTIKELKPMLDEALKKNDPLLNAKILKEENTKLVKSIKEKPQVVGAGVGAGIGIGVVGALYFRKRRKQSPT